MIKSQENIFSIQKSFSIYVLKNKKNKIFSNNIKLFFYNCFKK